MARVLSGKCSMHLPALSECLRGAGAVTGLRKDAEGRPRGFWKDSSGNCDYAIDRPHDRRSLLALC